MRTLPIASLALLAPAMLALLHSAPARADVVHLTNGRSVEGKVTEDGDKVTVVMAQGTISFPRSTVARIERGESSVEAFERRRAALARDDAAGRVELGIWALGVRMDRQAKELFREALTIDPDQPEARRRLGYVLHEGKWMTPDEKMQSLGLIRFEDAWMTPEAVAVLKRIRAEAQAAEEARRKAEAEAALKNAEAERLRLECERLEAGRLALENERTKLEAERVRLEAERRRLEDLLRRRPIFHCAAGHTWYHADCPKCRQLLVIPPHPGAKAEPEGQKDGGAAPGEPGAGK